MCNYIHTKATAFHAISAIIYSSERIKRGQKNTRVKGKTKELKKRKKGRQEIGLVTIFYVTGVIDNLEPRQGRLIW